jgi:hypothetical protein
MAKPRFCLHLGAAFGCAVDSHHTGINYLGAARRSRSDFLTSIKIMSVVIVIAVAFFSAAPATRASGSLLAGHERGRWRVLTAFLAALAAALGL